jgi:1-aminocyclopropane-1-carboxylate deaminase/D-cysteine desulfhydrase-like pyridoxal-dependent ACC family enzyme
MNEAAGSLIFNIPTPLQEINEPEWEAAGVRVFVKRDDLIHPIIQGNKWRKLMLHADKIRSTGIRHVYSFGGAYSNHLHALAYLGKQLNVKVSCFIRGDGFDPENPTLQFIRECGAECSFLNRSDYRERHDPDFIQSLGMLAKACYIPEGGADQPGVKGCTAIVQEVIEVMGACPDYWVLPVGSGTTLAGMLLHPGFKGRMIGIAAVADVALDKKISNQMKAGNSTGEKAPAWELSFRFHFGGFAKWDTDLIDFLRRFQERHGILLEPIYTAKLFFGLDTMIREKKFERGSTIVAVHTGGLQGREGFEKRFGVGLGRDAYLIRK